MVKFAQMNINDFYTDRRGRQWMATEYEGSAVLESGKVRLLGKKRRAA